jgi:ABC-type spermidine/putrescine transport system permease subunit II
MVRSSLERLVELAAGLLTAFVLIVLYAPVAVSAVFSVVEIDRGAVRWDSFTLERYVTLWSNESVTDAVMNTVLVAGSAVATATTLAVLLALYVQWRGAIGRRVLELIIYLPFLLPPIITGLSLLIASVELGIGRGLILIAIGHTAFVLAICFRLVLTRLQSLSPALIEASADLGASSFQTFRYILLPQLGSAIVSGAVLALTLSFDETLISVFLTADKMTLPIRLWAMMRVGFTAEINALVTIVLLVSILLAIVAALRIGSGHTRQAVNG